MNAIFWDNDGVLVNTEHLYYRATREVLATVGIELTEAMYVELFLVQAKGAWHLAAERGMSPEAVQQLREARSMRYAALLASEPILLPGIRELIESLCGTCTMGIVTSSRPDHFAIIHERTGLLPYFDFVLTSRDYVHSKPHPEPYLRAIERSGCPPEDCIVVEDSERGLIAARAAGLRCIVVPGEFTRASNFSQAYRVLESHADLAAELNNVWQDS
jgi:HAD superfamily hydrolase (TIGR01509 family)